MAVGVKGAVDVKLGGVLDVDACVPREHRGRVVEAEVVRT